jgi:hypothetical protein
MKIKTEEQQPGYWVAVDDETYDGPGSDIGCGPTEQEAVIDLLQIILDKMEVRLMNAKSAATTTKELLSNIGILS